MSSFLIGPELETNCHLVSIANIFLLQKYSKVREKLEFSLSFVHPTRNVNDTETNRFLIFFIQNLPKTLNIFTKVTVVVKKQLELLMPLRVAKCPACRT